MVSGVGATHDIAQNGDQISAGAKGQIETNIITNNVDALCLPGPNPEDCPFDSTNILVISNNVKLTTNTLGKSNVNIYLHGNNNIANNNVILDTDVFDGISTSGNNNKATTNTITNSDEAAIFVDTGTNNSVESNKINDAQTGILRTFASTGTVIGRGNTIFNTEVQVADPGSCRGPVGFRSICARAFRGPGSVTHRFR